MRISDWSTDVCSSDLCVLAESLKPVPADMPAAVRAVVDRIGETCEPSLCSVLFMAGAGGSLRAGVTEHPVLLPRSRSEEGRVGTECVSTGRSRGSPYLSKNTV